MSSVDVSETKGIDGAVVSADAGADEAAAAEVVPAAVVSLTTLKPPAPRSSAEPPPPPAVPPYALPNIALYHAPPSYPPPPSFAAAPSDARALVALLAAIGGLVLGLPLGIPGLALGPLAYFLGRSARARIDASNGAMGGRGMASAAWVLGVIATAIGALTTLAWFIFILVTISGLPPSSQ